LLPSSHCSPGSRWPSPQVPCGCVVLVVLVVVVVIGNVVETCDVVDVLDVVVVVVTGQFTQHGSEGVSCSVAGGWTTACGPIVGGVLRYCSRFCRLALSAPLMVIVVLDWMVFVPADWKPGPSAESTPLGVMLTVHPERSVAPPAAVPSVMTGAET